MPQVINTNIASLNSQRNLNSSQSALNTALQRLSSGLRINSAKDDAAGLSISERFTSQIRGLNQASRNANDGVSLAQTAEGALAEMGTALQRIRELSVQSVNATNSATDRAALNQEVSQLISELDRIASQTNFNGNYILNTSGGYNANFQVGANVNNVISLTVDNVSTTQMGVSSNYTTIQAEGTAATTSVFAARLVTQWNNGVSAGATLNGATLTTITSASNSVNKINAVNNSTAGVTAFSYGNSIVGSSNLSTTQAAVASGDIVINGISVGAIASISAISTIAAAINAVSNQTGVTANTSSAVSQALVLYNTTGNSISLQTNTATAATLLGVAQGATTMAAGANGAIVMNGDLAKTGLTVSAAAVAGALEGSTTDTTIALTSQNITSVTVNTVSTANVAMIAVDQAIGSINDLRARLGAIQNRLDSTIRNVQTTSENLSASRSRIQDADFAMETATLTRSQILQQAGVAMLAQANALPNNVLSLLK